MMTKKDYQELLLSLLEPLRNRFSKGSARIELDGAGTTYSQSVIEFESFARPLWGLVPFWIGGGRDPFFEEHYISGLANGSDPESSEYWGECEESDQRFVEMAPIAFALIAVPEILWAPLSERAKDNLSAWLYKINEHEMPKCNWYFFRIIVNTALKRLGRKYSAERIEEDAAFIESCYIGGGWYKDGVSGRTDYYSAFAMHFYPMLLAAFAGINQESARERALLFAEDYIYWFADSGEAIPYGRSLTYRFAQIAFWSALSLISDEDIGTVKGIIERCIEYWLGRSIFDSGILSIGYGYPNLTMAERYNGPGSPYWSLKAFMFLALPDEHPFWSCEAVPLPSLDGLKNELGRRLIQHRGWDTTMYEVGMLGMKSLGHFTEKYDKFAYSSSSPFSVSHTDETIEESAPDSMLSFVVNGTVFVRKGSKDFSICGNKVFSHWSPLPEVDVETTIEIMEDGHIRTHRIRSGVECIAYDSGFSREEAEGFADRNHAEVISSGIHSSVECICGEGEGTVISSDPNTNLLWRRSAIPSIRYSVRKGEIVISTKVRLWKE